MSNYVIPAFILFVILVGIFEKKNIYNMFIDGAKEGIKTVYNIFPYIFAITIIAGLLNDTKILNNIIIFGISGNILPLILMKPLSGGASMSIVIDIFKNMGPDTTVGIIASILMASTETTLYVISIFSSKVKIENMRVVIIAGLIGDLTAIIATILIVTVN